MKRLSIITKENSKARADRQLHGIATFFTTITLVIAVIGPHATTMAQQSGRRPSGDVRVEESIPSPLNTKSVSAKLTVAARAFGVEIQPEHTAFASGNGISVVAAPVAGIEDVPARALPADEGVDTMFVYVKAPDHSKLPSAGYYLVRTRASKEAVEAAFEATHEEGATPPEGNASMEFIDASGKVAAKFESASLQHVLSLDVHEEAHRSRNFVDVSKEGSPASNPRVPGDQVDMRVRVWVECSNGWRACLDISW